MFIDNEINFIMTILLFGFLIIVVSFVIPVYGYHRKQMKGMAWGCLLQPVVCFICITLLLFCVVGYEYMGLRLKRNSAMVTVMSTEPGVCGVDTITWYLKSDGECLAKRKMLEKSDSEEFDDEDYDEEYEQFDVIRLDSLTNAVCVEDHIIIRFDLKNQKATATDYDLPIEVISVDWDKVNTYFKESLSETIRQ